MELNFLDVASSDAAATFTLAPIQRQGEYYDVRWWCIVRD